MWTVREMSKIVCLVILAILTAKDVRTRMVPMTLLLAAGAGSLGYQILYGQEDLWQVVLGAAVGAVFLFVSKVTREGFGYGDSIGILILGIFLGFSGIISVLMTAFFLLLCVSIPMLIRKNMSKKAALPFYPFLMGGYICLLLAEGMK